jgi:hypothetical protein
MVAISVESEEDAFRRFETLNDRGLRLSVPDLLLNYLMRRANNNDERARIREKWNSMLDKMGRRDIDRFFRHMWLSKYGDVKARGLFHEIRNHSEQQQISSVEFADTCAEECDHYVAIIDLDAKTLGSALPTVAGVVKYLEVSSSLPLLLSGLRCLTASDFEKLATMTVGLVIRHSLIMNLNPSDLETAFYQAAREIRAKREAGESSAKSLRQARFILAQINPPDDQVSSTVEMLFLTRNEAQYVLTTLANAIQSKTREIGVGDANLEHIFPLSPSDEWQNTDELEPFTWHIGNLTVLGKRLNRKAANSGFKTKRAYYARSEVKITKGIAKKYRKWSESEILDRTNSLSSQIVKTWPGPHS